MLLDWGTGGLFVSPMCSALGVDALTPSGSNLQVCRPVSPCSVAVTVDLLTSFSFAGTLEVGGTSQGLVWVRMGPLCGVEILVNQL